ncbi:MAG: hypothetical protein IT514_15525 [Burkholderiales bacterium]|nr:hypothetical protein [Burkholderiales bacterium]
MKRQSEAYESMVYAYACGEPLAGEDAAMAELARCRELWDRLVEIDRAAERALLDAAGRDVPEIAASVELAWLLTAQLREAKTQAEIRGRVKQRKAAWASTWKPLAQWKRDHKDDADAIQATMWAEVTKARQESPAWWPNYNATIQRFTAARSGVRKFGRRLRLADPEREDGVLDVQIMRTKTGLGAAPGELQDGTVSALQVGYVDPAAYDPHTFLGMRRKLRITIVEMRVDRAGATIRLPLIMHRPLPNGWRVKAAQLTFGLRERKRRWQLTLTLSRPAAHGGDMAVTGCLPAHVTSPTAVLAMCYQPLPDGSLRVVEGDETLDLPGDWMRGMDRVERLQAAIYESFAREMAIWSEDHDPHRTPEEWAEVLLTRLRSGLRVPQYARVWRELYVGWRNEMLELRGTLLGRRLDLYRRWTADVVTRHRVINVTRPLLAVVAQADRDKPENSLRQRAALSILEHWLVHQARKHGRSLTIASAPVATDVDTSKIRKISRKQRAEIVSARSHADNSLNA